MTILYYDYTIIYQSTDYQRTLVEIWVVPFSLSHKQCMFCMFAFVCLEVNIFSLAGLEK